MRYNDIGRLLLSLLCNAIVLLSPYRTLTAPVDFKECIIAIRDNAFSASMYPVIITLEDHLPKALQSEASTVCPSFVSKFLHSSSVSR